jgi:mono/diheme cytochrome c family protein
MQAIAPNRKISPALLDVRYLMPVSESANDLDEGKAVYLANCSGCHGTDGRATTPGGQSLRPVAFNLAGFGLQPDVVWRALEQGVPGTAMPSWNELPSSEFKAVADYVLSISTTPDLRPEDRWTSPQRLMTAGQRIFETHYVRCHGEAGGGDGPEANNYLPRPANLQGMRLSYDGAARVIHEGVPGSGMPAWPLLTPAEIQAVTWYMRSFYQGLTPSSATRQVQSSSPAGMEAMQ